MNKYEQSEFSLNIYSLGVSSVFRFPVKPNKQELLRRNWVRIPDHSPSRFTFLTLISLLIIPIYNCFMYIFVFVGKNTSWVEFGFTAHRHSTVETEKKEFNQFIDHLYVCNALNHLIYFCNILSYFSLIRIRRCETKQGLAIVSCIIIEVRNCSFPLLLLFWIVILYNAL